MYSLDTAGSLIELGPKGSSGLWGRSVYEPDARTLWVLQTPVCASEPWAPCPSAHLHRGHPIRLHRGELRPEKRDAETGILDPASL